MMKFVYPLRICFFIVFTFVAVYVFADHFPDQYHEVTTADSLFQHAESYNNVILSEDSKNIILVEGEQEGYIIMNPVTLEHEFNRGLPSWNGSAPEFRNSSFKVEMRFQQGESWSNWATVGFWDNYIWSSYGDTDFDGGYVDIDYVKLDYYCTTYQFKVSFKRTDVSYDSPGLRQLGFFASDTEYPIDIASIVLDNPDEIFIDTEFFCQYDIDDNIGGSICSPTSVAMILRSYDIYVDPLKFAQRNRDPYWGMYGVWPRVVAHASEYGLKGSVTRYRTWSDAAEILQNGGRISMSVGLPLYQGHLIMLAGFNQYGDPIVHDPAKSNGYAYVFNKNLLSQSWFEKGGISYTFYLQDSSVVSTRFADEKMQLSLYPNPLTDISTLEFSLEREQQVSLNIFDINGRLVASVLNRKLNAGSHAIALSKEDFNLVEGVYFLNLNTEKSNSAQLIFVQ
jgi:hypothetical protein